MTKECQLISKVLNSIPKELKLYDTLKTKVKKFKKIELQNEAMTILVKLQTMVGKVVTDMKSEIKIWEQNFMIENNMSVPISANYKSESHIAIKVNRIKIGEKLLKSYWKMKLYHDI